MEDFIEDYNNYNPKTVNESKYILNKLLEKHKVDYYSLMIYAKVNGGL